MQNQTINTRTIGIAASIMTHPNNMIIRVSIAKRIMLHFSIKKKKGE